MALKVYYVRADWCVPCLENTDSMFLPKPDGTAGDLVNEYYQARNNGEIQFLLADITDGADLDYYQSFFGALVAPMVIFWENQSIIAKYEGTNEIQAVPSGIADAGIEADPLPDLSYDIIKTQAYPNWWLLAIASYAAYRKTNQAWTLTGVPLSLFASTQYKNVTIDAIGKIVKDKPPGLEQCADGRWTTSTNQGRCSYHGGTLVKRVAKVKEDATQEIVDLIENPSTGETVEVPVLGVYRFSSYTTRKGKTGESIEVDFYEIPAYEIRQQLKDARFWWNRQDKVWVNWDKEEARQLVERLPLAMEGEEVPVLTQRQIKSRTSCSPNRALPIKKGTIAKNRKQDILDCIFANAANVVRYDRENYYNGSHTTVQGLRKEWNEFNNAKLAYKGDGVYSLDFHSSLWYQFESNFSNVDKKQQVKPKPIISNDVAIVKMRALADRMDDHIEEKYNPATAGQNPTARRARIIASMEQDGDRLRNIQDGLRSIVKAREENDLPKSLARISTKIEVADLMRGYIPQLNREKVGDFARYASERAAKQIEKISARFPNEWVFPTREQLRMANEAYSLTDPKEASWLTATSQLKDLNRLFRMGITTKVELEAARADLKTVIEKYGEGELSPRELRERKLRDMANKLIGTKIPGYFPTPKPVLERMTNLVPPRPNTRILEPSAGAGDIADHIKNNFYIKPKVIEINYRLREILKEKGYKLIGDDFLQFEGREFDLIYMNPPFEKLADIDHVKKAFSLLAPGGQLVSVMSESPFFRREHKAVEFREWMDQYGYSEKLPTGSFLESRSSTGVNTRLVVLDKPDSTIAGLSYASINIHYV